jgi:hypothetical protein
MRYLGVERAAKSEKKGGIVPASWHPALRFVGFVRSLTLLSRLSLDGKEYTMASAHNLCLGVIATAAILLLSSCSGAAAPGTTRAGPHSQGRVYGNRHLYGYDLTYDPALGVYVVVGLMDYYYEDGFFFRLRSGVWQVSLRADDWHAVTREMLPSGLKAKVQSTGGVDDNASAKANANNSDKVSGQSPVPFSRPDGPTKQVAKDLR